MNEQFPQPFEQPVKPTESSKILENISARVDSGLLTGKPLVTELAAWAAEKKLEIKESK